jgi:hypothetical protein
MNIQVKIAAPDLMESFIQDENNHHQCTIIASGIITSSDFKRLREVIDNTESFYRTELQENRTFKKHSLKD